MVVRSARRTAAPGSGPAGPYVWGTDGKLTWFVSDRKRYVVATPDSISEIDRPPSAVAAALARWRPRRAEVRHAGEYAVSVENQGHGFVRLLVRSPVNLEAHVIAKGGWEPRPPAGTLSRDLGGSVRLSLTSFGTGNRRRSISNPAKTFVYSIILRNRPMQPERVKRSVAARHRTPPAARSR